MSKLGAISDAGAASWSLAKHVMGGAAIGAGVNSVAYANGASLTNSQSFGQAALSGAAWGAAAGGVTGAAGFRKNMKINANARAAKGAEVANAKNTKPVSPPGGGLRSIRHTAGDLATSLYGNIRSLTPAGRRSKIEKEGMLREQANKIIDQKAADYNKWMKTLEPVPEGTTKYDAPAFMRKGGRSIFAPTSGHQMTMGFGRNGSAQQMDIFGSTAQNLEVAQAKNVKAADYRKHIAPTGNQKSFDFNNSGASQGDLFT